MKFCPKSATPLVLAWYRPPSDPIRTFEKLETVLSFLDNEGKEKILLGDTNCDLTRSIASHPNHDRHMKEFMIYSRTSLRTSSLIGHIATTCPNNIVDSGVLQVSMSDHCPVYCLRKLNGARRKDHKVIKARSMKNFDEAAFLADVSQINWDRVVGRPVDINVFFDDWSNLFSMIIYKHAPIRSTRVSEKYCPWINKNLKGLIRERDELKEAVKHNSSPLMESTEKFETRSIESMLILIESISWKTYPSSGQHGRILEDNQTIINKRSKSTNIELLSNKGTEIIAKKEISNVISKYFCSVGRDLAGKIDKSPNPLLSGDYDINPLKSTFVFNSIQAQHVSEAIDKIKSSKSFWKWRYFQLLLEIGLSLYQKLPCSLV